VFEILHILSGLDDLGTDDRVTYEVTEALKAKNLYVTRCCHPEEPHYLLTAEPPFKAYRGSSTQVTKLDITEIEAISSGYDWLLTIGRLLKQSPTWHLTPHWW
jgi:hypothetical protein